jgi:hypothetical protein
MTSANVQKRKNSPKNFLVEPKYLILCLMCYFKVNSTLDTSPSYLGMIRSTLEGEAKISNIMGDIQIGNLFKSKVSLVTY